jgi:hypothetical protein
MARHRAFPLINRIRRPVLVGALALAAGALAAGPAAATTTPFLHGLGTVTEVASTVPTTGTVGVGDVNPYGIVVVPQTIGNLVQGDVLVSNFNDAANNQGTGRTIVQISPTGTQTVFAAIAGGNVGLTTALAVLPKGFVAVGSLPTTNGQSSTAMPGALFILDSTGHLVKTIRGGNIAGPWDMTTSVSGNKATLFVTNVLNGTLSGQGRVINAGTIDRLVIDFTHGSPKIQSDQVIATGFAERTDPAALVVGPTGLGLGADGQLYVADTVNSTIRVIPDALHRRSPAGTGRLVSKSPSLVGPLGLAIAPNGDILTVNAGNGDVVEITPGGDVVATATLDSSGTPPGAGALFGLAVASAHSLYFVDDATNQLDRLSGP